MERKKASDFPQELSESFDGYVHGRMSRRDFLDGAQKFAVGGLTATALFEMLKPNYAWAIQVPKDDSRIKAEVRHGAVAAGQWQHQGLSGAACECGRQGARRSGHPREPRPQSLYRRRGAAVGDRRTSWRSRPTA